MSSASLLKDVMNPVPPVPGDDSQALAPQTQQGQEPTRTDPNTKTPEQNQAGIQLTEKEKQELMKLRREYKTSWSPNRRVIVKRVLRAFEVLKNNPYLSFDPDGFQWYDPLSAVTNGDSDVDVELYKYNNNIYQMLALSFIAALSPQVPKSRYQPEDADDELDLATARRASTMMAIIERKNGIKALQKLELLHLWTGGCYFSYTRYIVDGDRAGTRKQPIIQMCPVTQPDYYQCPQCGAQVNTNSLSPWTGPKCSQCGTPLGEEDYYPGEQVMVPQQVGEEELPNGMVRMDCFGPSNVDAAPYANDLFETPILDLEVETDVAAVRASYEGAWDQIQANTVGSGDPDGEPDRLARIQMSTSTGARSGYLSASLVTYSRCWFQSWSFNRINDKNIAAGLKTKFPNGCKLVTVNGSQFLEAVSEKLTQLWTHCATVKGMGLYPFAVGDAALDIQDRINDVANITHEHMDRNASPTIIGDDDAFDGEALNGQAMPPGRFMLIKRKGALAGRPLSDVLFQPQFHIDTGIYSYGENLIQLAQLVSGVMPQIFGGGTTTGVDTASGQRQMLNTALGRLGLFWEQIREEHAYRAENAVRCFANNMGQKVAHVIEGDTESGFENEIVLLTEMQGSFHAYPESDQGFPATWAEIRDRLMDLLQEANNEFVQEFLGDPDNLKTLARYILPPDTKVPGDSARTKYKRIVGLLAKGQPFQVAPQEAAQLGIIVQGPIFLPQDPNGNIILPDPDFDTDTLGMAVQICLDWGKRNWKMAQDNPPGYENVRAYLRIAAQKQAEMQIKQQLAAAQAALPGAEPSQAPPGPQAAPPPGA